MIWIYLDRFCHKLFNGRERSVHIHWLICQRAMLWADKNDRWEEFD